MHRVCADNDLGKSNVDVPLLGRHLGRIFGITNGRGGYVFARINQPK